MFINKDAGCVVDALIEAIRENKDYLSEVDGKIGDGDHGVNMNKGFTLCKERLEKKGAYSMSEGLRVLSETLMDDIGGSMGPLYGMLFEAMSDESQDHEQIDERVFDKMLGSALEGVEEIGSAKLNDKTLLDTLIPARLAFGRALESGADFNVCLDEMTKAAEAGWKATEGMIAKVGRASRLGERSRGVLDAGATSCFILLRAFAEAIKPINK